jgi:AraC-like DNA-binding protein
MPPVANAAKAFRAASMVAFRARRLVRPAILLPHAYIAEWRLARAQRLLIESTMSITEIAIEVRMRPQPL